MILVLLGQVLILILHIAVIAPFAIAVAITTTFTSITGVRRVLYLTF